MTGDSAEALYIAHASSNGAKRWCGGWASSWRLEGNGLPLPYEPTSTPVKTAAEAMWQSGYPHEVFFSLGRPSGEVVWCGSIAEGLASAF
jgi:hypothetical protein